jgi:hypothetical protein
MCFEKALEKQYAYEQFTLMGHREVGYRNPFLLSCHAHSNISYLIRDSKVCQTVCSYLLVKVV